jgi:ABC-type glycerol-3-phosphate transport system substrate-binding protein
MKKIAFAAFASAAALSLAACGGEPAPTETESVETAPDEVMTGDATDVPTEAASEAM